MSNYKCTVEYSSKPLSPREKLKVMDTTGAIKLDNALKDGSIRIAPDYYAVLHIENEKSNDKTYRNYIVVDKDGEKYVTGSDSFFRTFSELFDVMADTGEDYEIDIFTRPSKNYAGNFITCSIV